MELRGPALGTFQCSPDDEPWLTRSAAADCRSVLRAVSYQDEGWWLSETGDRYLEVHAQLHERDVEMTRVFIVRPDELHGEDRDDLLAVFEAHRNLGIQTYVLTTEQVPDHLWRDFVVYDSELLRNGELTSPNGDRKNAEFTDDPGRIDLALKDFNDLVSLAKRDDADAERVAARVRRAPIHL